MNNEQGMQGATTHANGDIPDPGKPDNLQQFLFSDMTIADTVKVSQPEGASDLQASFEAWSKREGGLNLLPAPHKVCEDGRLFATYFYARTESAWRAWANKPACAAAPVVAESGVVPADLSAALKLVYCHLRGTDTDHGLESCSDFKDWCATLASCLAAVPERSGKPADDAVRQAKMAGAPAWEDVSQETYEQARQMHYDTRILYTRPAPADSKDEVAQAHELLSKHCVAITNNGAPMSLLERIEELYSWYASIIHLGAPATIRIMDENKAMYLARIAELEASSTASSAAPSDEREAFRRTGKCVAYGSARVIVATAISAEWADRFVAALATARQPEDKGLSAAAGVKLRSFQADHDKAWHVVIEHPFGTTWARMGNVRDVKLAELIAASPPPSVQGGVPEAAKGVLTYEKPGQWGCLMYRHREGGKNQAYQFADEADAEVYAKTHALTVCHASPTPQGASHGE